MNLDLSFGSESQVEKPKADPEKLERLIGVLQRKADDLNPARYLISLSFEELDDLVYFLEENVTPSEQSIQTILKRLQAKIALIEKAG